MKKVKSIICLMAAAILLSVSILISSGAAAVQASGLPARVDNSTLQCFPPIIDQGSASSCVSMATTYYQMTHMVGLKRNLDAKNNESNRFSPRWSYNFFNGGSVFRGGRIQDALSILYNHGAATFTEFPYPDPADPNFPDYFRNWPLDENIWLNAISNKIDKYGTITIGDIGIETPVTDVNDLDLTELKQYLHNGYILSFESSSLGYWSFTTISDDPNTYEDNNGSPIGKNIAYAVAAGGGHAMTVVGYDDHVWTDINVNGIVDPGEKGALKIANSFGENQSSHNSFQYGDGGFIWLAYDALNKVSSVYNALPLQEGTGTTRLYAFDGNTLNSTNTLFWLTAKEDYTPDLIGKFTINHKNRDDIIISLGYSDTNSTTPTNQIDLAVFSYDLFEVAGNKAFDGSDNFVDGTFYFDYSDLVRQYNLGDGTTKRWYLIVWDFEKDAIATTVKNFQLINYSSQVIADTGSINLTVDGAVMSPPIYLDAAVKVMPRNLKAVVNGQNINLTWDPVVGAAGYEVSINNGTFFSVGANTSYTHTVNTENKVYSFKVRALNSSNSIIGTESQTFSVRGILTGDVDGDGTITYYDSDLVCYYLYGYSDLTYIQKVAADVDGDGMVTDNDYNTLWGYVKGTVAELPAEPVKLIGYGDVNCDGYINKTDEDLISSYLLKEIVLTDVQMVVADVTGDNSVGTLDSYYIKKYYVGTINEFPVATSN